MNGWNQEIGCRLLGNLSMTRFVRRFFVAAVAALVLALALPAERSDGFGIGSALAQQEGHVPGGTLGNQSDPEMWRAIRKGIQGTVSIPNKQAGVLVQSEGDNWRAWRNGPLTDIGLWILGGMIGLLLIFFLIRGRIRIDSGPSDYQIERFTGVERFAHWLTAVSFVVLALTGLNLLYGRYFLLPVLGPDIFAFITSMGKYLHNYLAFSFMLGIVMMFVLWVRHNLPNRHDVTWALKGGGIFAKGVHPPAKKFNAGQKVIFWLVILGGASLSASGVALLFPFQLSMFAGTFEIVNLFGADLPTTLTAMQEMQLSQLWHGIVGLVMIAVILAHIYIGSIGMEGAFDAMGSGMVDLNWAKEHHSLWVKEEEEKARHQGAMDGAKAGAD